VYLCVDIAASSRWPTTSTIHSGPFRYTICCTYGMTVSLAAGGMGLGNVWAEQKARQTFADAGFTSVEVKHVEVDIFNNCYVAIGT
jgi:hypothetical protein